MKVQALALTISGFFIGEAITQHSNQHALRQSCEDRGTFRDPSASIRTKFRYWVPDASVDIDAVQADIAAVARIGGGGVELYPYYNYGDINPGYIPTDWTKYGWGLPPWSK